MINSKILYTEVPRRSCARIFTMLVIFDDKVAFNKEFRLSHRDLDSRSLQAQISYMIMRLHREACLDWLFHHRGTLGYKERKIFRPLFRISSIEEFDNGAYRGLTRWHLTRN